MTRSMRAPFALVFATTMGALLCTPAIVSAARPHAPADSAVAPAPGLISATGSGLVTRKPDYLEVVVGAEFMAPRATEAQAQTGATMARIVAAIEALKLAGAEIQTARIDLRPRYSRDRDEEQAKLLGYVATSSVRVKTSDVQAGAKVIDAALASGATRIDGLNFGINEAIAAREEALKLAVGAAKRKAQAMSDALGVGMGRLVRAEESQSGGWGQAQFANRVGAGDDGAPSGPVVPGSVEIRVEATLTFEVRQ